MLLKNYWGQTGSLESIRYVFVSLRSETLRNQLSELLSDTGLSAEQIRSDVNYRDLARGDESTIWNLLFHAGYSRSVKSHIELAKSFSYHDIAGGEEKIYHALSLGLFVGGTNYNYKVESNKESGYRTQLSPHHPTAGKRSIIFEFKILWEIRSEDYSAIESKLRTLAEDGLNQIPIRQ